MANEKIIPVPDIGGASGVDVIEILVKEGDTVAENDPLITLESDKASMEIPSPMAGVVRTLHVTLGNKVSEGDAMVTLEVMDAVAEKSEDKPGPTHAPVTVVAVTEAPPTPSPVKPSVAPQPQVSDGPLTAVSAGPAARRLARELGVSLANVSGSGRNARISKEDILHYVKQKMSQPTSGAGLALPEAPVIDFSKFGEIEVKPLHKIKRVTGANVHRSWVTIPHVTQFDEADITNLEAFRVEESVAAKAAGYKLTLLAFVCKVVSKALEVYPQFNASLDATGANLIYKRYCHIGIAVETPNGLVVPVIRDVNHLSLRGIAEEMARLSTKARDKGLMPTDMSGGSFTISSLGGIGGTAFTPIVNSPEVAILGLSRSRMTPVYEAGEFKPRLMLPLSLSYDHRVIDGAEAARFTRFIADGLNDLRRILL